MSIHTVTDNTIKQTGNANFVYLRTYESIAIQLLLFLLQKTADVNVIAYNWYVMSVARY